METTKTALQIARKHTWTIYGLAIATGMRDKLRFRWNKDEPDFDNGALELRVWHRSGHINRKWWEFGEDFTIGLTKEGTWYVYAWKCHFSNVSGPETCEMHIGDFPGFETAFCAMLLEMASEIVDGIADIRYEREMDRIQQSIE